MKKLVSKHFKTEIELLKFSNSDHDVQFSHTISIVKDFTSGDWILFYFID